MRASKIFTACAVAACLAVPGLSQGPPRIDRAACVATYIRLSDAANHLYYLVPNSERDHLAGLAESAGDAADLVNLQSQSAAQLCGPERMAAVNALNAQLCARHDRLEAAKEQKRIAGIEALIAKELAAAPPDPPPES